MNKKGAWLLWFALIGTWPLLAVAELGGSLDCPTTVNVGEPLAVTVALSNTDCSNFVNVRRIIRGVAGNSGGSLRLLGPKVRTLDPPEMVPPATGCDTFNILPGETSFTMNATGRVPEAFANQAVLVFVERINNRGHGKGELFCITQVTR